MQDTSEIPWHRIFVACLIGSTVACGVALIGIFSNYLLLFTYDETLHSWSMSAYLVAIISVGLIIALLASWAVGLAIGFPLAMIAIGRGWDSWIHALLLGGAVTFVPAVFSGMGRDPLVLCFATLAGIVGGLTTRRFALGTWT